MKTRLLLCLVSGLLGAAGTIAWTHLLAPPRVSAQQLAPRPSVERHGLSQPVRPARAAAAPNAAAALWEDPELTAEERVNVHVYELANRSVVNITTKSEQVDPMFMFSTVAEGAGSGMVLDREGHILTNNHVVEDADELNVVLHDGKTYQGRLVGRDASTDVAIVKIDAPRESLEPIRLGDATHLKVGQRVYAIGNPFGLERTLTTGIISSLGRSLPTRNGRTIKQMIQLDAAINPGNSGGPLLDSRGRVIGMNTAIFSKTGQNVGVGFAIPTSSLTRVIPELIRNGRVIRPEIGIARVYETDDGLLVASLVPDGPADKAGIQGFRVVRERRRQGVFVYETRKVDRSAADLIVAVEGQPTKTVDEFLTAVEKHRPGDEVVVAIVREGHRREVKVRLGTSES